MLKLSQWQPIQPRFSVYLTYSHHSLIYTLTSTFPYFFFFLTFLLSRLSGISLFIDHFSMDLWYHLVGDSIWKPRHGYMDFFFTFLKIFHTIVNVTFHLQLLQNIGYIPHVVQHISEPVLYPMVRTSRSSTPILPLPLRPTGNH